MKLAIYTFCVMISAIGLSGINFNGLFRTNKIIEARIFAVIVSIIMGYLLGNFVLEITSLA